MSGHVLAIVNMKGGVGKTSLVVGLAETLAMQEKKPVLVIDLDAQASASYCIAGNRALTRLIEQDRTVDSYFYAALINGPRRRIDELVCGPATNVTSDGENLEVSLLASSVDLRLTERKIIYELTNKGDNLARITRKVTELLQPDLERLRQAYSYILIDCAPGISTFTDAAIRNADLILVPTIPDFISHAGLTAFVKNILVQERAHKVVATNRQPFVILSKIRPIRQHHDYSQLIRTVAARADSGFTVLRTEVKEMAAFPTAIEHADDEYPPTYHEKYGPNLSLVLISIGFELKEALR